MHDPNILDDNSFEQEYDNDLSTDNVFYYQNLVLWARFFSTCGFIATGLIGLIFVAIGLNLPLNKHFLIYYCTGWIILAAWGFLMVLIKKYAADLKKYTQNKHYFDLQNALKWKKWIFIAFSVISSICALFGLRFFI